MGKHKEENGTTRVGEFLRSLGDVGKPILKAAGGLTGQAWLSTIADGIKTSSELNEEQKDHALELHLMDAKDRASARDLTKSLNNSEYASWISKNMPAIIAISLTIIISGALYGLMKMEVPEANKAIVYSLIGTIGTAWLASIYFWVGSSVGSKQKTEGMIKELKR